MKYKIFAFLGLVAALTVASKTKPIAVSDGRVPTEYRLKATIVEQDNNNEVLCEDENGNTWVFLGRGFWVGDEVTLIVNNANTRKNIYDDTIVGVETAEK